MCLPHPTPPHPLGKGGKGRCPGPLTLSGSAAVCVCVCVCVCVVRPTSVLLSYSTDNSGHAFYSDDVIELPLQLPVILRCHVTVQSANHVEPNVTVSFDDADMTSQFARSTTLSSRSQDGGLLTTTDYSGELAWNVTLKHRLLDLHTSNWSCTDLEASSS